MKRCGRDASGLSAASAMEKYLSELRHLGAVGRAAALAFAAVLLLAAVVAALAAALSLAVVLSFTGVLGWLVGIGVTQAGLGCFYRRVLCVVCCGSVSRDGSAHQTGESSGEQHCTELVLHIR